MPSPVIFLSAATVDLKTWRDHLHHAFSRAGFRVLTQEHSLRAAPGNVKRLLTETIAEADCVIHLAGMGYGSHATDPFPGAPSFQCSWTQFEYYHAHEQRKDVIAFVCAPNLSAQGFKEKSIAPADLALKQHLQQEHRDRVASGQFTDTPLDGVIVRTSNETADSAGKLLESVAAAIGTLRSLERGDREKAQRELRAIASDLAGMNRKLIAALVLLMLISLGVWLVKQDAGSLRDDVEAMKQVNAEIKKEVSEVRSIHSRERSIMARIIARANENIAKWENMTPKERFDLALDEIAHEDRVPTKEMRDLLELYVQLVEADPDADTEDKYYVLMRKGQYEQAAELMNKDGQSAEERMKQRALRKNALEALEKKVREIKEKEAVLENQERKHAVSSYQKEGDAYRIGASFEKAIAAYERAASLTNQTSDPLEWADAQEWVAFVCHDLARYKEVELLTREIVSLREEKLGPDAPKLATALNNLALLLKVTNRLDEAEPLMRRALNIREANYGPTHSDIAKSLNNLASLYFKLNRLREAEPLMLRALRIYENNYGPSHPEVGPFLNNLAQLLQATNRLSEAEPLMRRGLEIEEKSRGEHHPFVAIQLNNLAQLLIDTNRLSEAGPLLQRALKIDEASYGPNHPNVAVRLMKLGMLLQDTNHASEAELHYNRALKIMEDSYGTDHPDIATCLNNLATLYYSLDRMSEAEPLIRRALNIDEESYKDNHPDVARDLNNLALLLQATKRLNEAEPLYLRALKIDEASYGTNHPKVATDFNNLATLYYILDRLGEAEVFSCRTVGVFLSFRQSTGHEHPNFQQAVKNFLSILTDLRVSKAKQRAKLESLASEIGLGPAEVRAWFGDLLPGGK